MDEITVSRVSIVIALDVMEWILEKHDYADVAAAVTEFREALGLLPEVEDDYI